jgi:hypothetical protein
MVIQWWFSGGLSNINHGQYMSVLGLLGFQGISLQEFPDISNMASWELPELNNS